jgi:uncharacterized protein (UPF0332 family)
MKEQDEILALLKKAQYSIKGAEVSFDSGLYDFSVGRSYYAMFYWVQAILLTKNLSFSKHSAVIAEFGKEFIKPKLIPQRFRDYLVYAFETRHEGDYGSPGVVNKDKAKKLIDESKDFFEIIESYLKEKEYIE